MSAPRTPAPELPGFTFLKGLGGGGFADVFLYQQRRPQREVAIKVLRDEHLSEDNLEQFETEADVMAGLSSHPHIVTIHAADVAPDKRPYIVMEYCPQPHFGLRSRGGTMPVAEVLRVSVQVASAVDAAHAAGVLHRDIKPANILTDAYGNPALTDFGIAGVARGDTVRGASGLSIAYSAPEVIRDPNLTGSVAADVYSLGATTYCLLAGRSPHWIPGGDNDDQILIARILGSSAPPVGRGDIPPELERLLAQSLAPDPDARPATARQFASALQDIEQSLRLPPTPMPAMQVAAPTPRRRSDEHDDERTERNRISVVDPDADDPPVPVDPSPSRHGQHEDDRTQRREGRGRPRREPPKVAPPPPPDVVAVPASPAVTAPAPEPPRPPRPRRPWPVVAAAAGVVALVVIGALLAEDDHQSTPTTTTESPADTEVPAAAPEAPSAVVATLGADGVLSATIQEPDSVDTDGLQYLVARNDGLPWPDQQRVIVDASAGGSTNLSISGLDPASEVCIDVYSKRGSLLSALPTTTCASAASGAPEG